jgi:hypothetical protein
MAQAPESRSASASSNVRDVFLNHATVTATSLAHRCPSPQP